MVWTGRYDPSVCPIDERPQAAISVIHSTHLMPRIGARDYEDESEDSQYFMREPRLEYSEACSVLDGYGGYHGVCSTNGCPGFLSFRLQLGG